MQQEKTRWRKSTLLPLVCQKLWDNCVPKTNRLRLTLQEREGKDSRWTVLSVDAHRPCILQVIE